MNYKFYDGIIKLTNFYLETMYNPIIIGKENIPDTNFILAGNHKNMQDPIILAYAFEDKYLNFMAKKEAFDNKLFKYFLENLGAFPIDRGNFDMKAVKYAINLLKAGKNLAIFPEGTRNEELGEFKSGVAGISQIAKTPIVPFAITGDYKFRTDLILNIGQPINFKELNLKKDEKDEYLREQVKSLIIK